MLPVAAIICSHTERRCLLESWVRTTPLVLLDLSDPTRLDEHIKDSHHPARLYVIDMCPGDADFGRLSLLLFHLEGTTCSGEPRPQVILTDMLGNNIKAVKSMAHLLTGDAFDLYYVPLQDYRMWRYALMPITCLAHSSTAH